MNLPKDFSFTQSNLQDYVDCAYRFYLRYYLRARWPALIVDDALDFEARGQLGARFHRLAQQYLLGVPEERLSDLASADPNPELRRWWDSFLIHVPSLLEGQRFPEAVLRTNLAGSRLTAKYDLILISPDGSLVIFDWKTTKKPVRKSWLLERVQTRVYRFILARSGKVLTGEDKTTPEQIIMHYWFAAHPESTVTLAYDPPAYQKDQVFLTNLIREIQSRDPEDFLRTSDFDKCRFCVYRSHCDRGKEAGPLDSFDEFDIEPDNEQIELDFDRIGEIEF